MDNCRCSFCINQDTMQKDLDTFEIPQDIQASSVEETADGLKIRWSGTDGHESFYPWDFLNFYLENDRRQPEAVRLENFGSDGPKSVRLSYEDFYPGHNELRGEEADRVVGRLTGLIARHGLAFIDNVPTSSAEPTQKLLEKIAFIRETHYGGFYDFIPDLAMADTAYTNIALPAHTDNTYFSDPAGLQAFHMLSHTGAPEGSASTVDLGGQSLLVDGFHAAEILRREDAEAFEVLCAVKLPWHASGNRGITIAPHKRYPVLELASEEDGGSGGAGQLHRVRWNTADRGVVPFSGDGDGKTSPEAWYAAARKFDGILRRKDVEYWVQLKPGTLLVFDNWRVLHGRAAFTGVRRMCGGYINRDDYISRWRNTNFSRQEIMDRIVG
ncbi:trimethyllysine dioxygenase [Microdochium trichocladiopsis]|uniref:Trimethyllysine dioxygenase n=1 Tax=Microdochium trichocladiopsis TaxID=1682393 RepID=A0A9P9BRG7_9PEZI|nr:trimethyllysine dioxygenase [Microdochium trichocladiopsis]KAH7032891.1 trimethyllysine dioxygenase [Microdochium trichocladiopsis]